MDPDTEEDPDVDPPLYEVCIARVGICNPRQCTGKDVLRIKRHWKASSNIGLRLPSLGFCRVKTHDMAECDGELVTAFDGMLDADLASRWSTKKLRKKIGSLMQWQERHEAAVKQSALDEWKKLSAAARTETFQDPLQLLRKRWEGILPRFARPTPKQSSPLRSRPVRRSAHPTTAAWLRFAKQQVEITKRSKSRATSNDTTTVGDPLLQSHRFKAKKLRYLYIVPEGSESLQALKRVIASKDLGHSVVVVDGEAGSLPMIREGHRIVVLTLPAAGNTSGRQWLTQLGRAFSGVTPRTKNAKRRDNYQGYRSVRCFECSFVETSPLLAALEQYRLRGGYGEIVIAGGDERSLLVRTITKLFG